MEEHPVGTRFCLPVLVKEYVGGSPAAINLTDSYKSGQDLYVSLCRSSHEAVLANMSKLIECIALEACLKIRVFSVSVAMFLAVVNFWTVCILLRLSSLDYRDSLCQEKKMCLSDFANMQMHILDYVANSIWTPEYHTHLCFFFKSCSI